MMLFTAAIFYSIIMTMLLAEGRGELSAGPRCSPDRLVDSG